MVRTEQIATLLRRGLLLELWEWRMIWLLVFGAPLTSVKVDYGMTDAQESLEDIFGHIDHPP